MEKVFFGGVGMRLFVLLLCSFYAQFALAASVQVDLADFDGTASHIDFEGLGLPYANNSPVYVSGHQFTGSAGTLRYADFTSGGNDYGLGTHGESQSIIVQLNSGYEMVGLDFGVKGTVDGNYWSWSGYVEFYGESGALLGTVNGSGINHEFGGWLSTDDKIKMLRIYDTAPNNGAIITIDNLYTQASVVPIPAAVWLFGSGLGLLGWFRRRQTA